MARSNLVSAINEGNPARITKAVTDKIDETWGYLDAVRDKLAFLQDALYPPNKTPKLSEAGMRGLALLINETSEDAEYAHESLENVRVMLG